MSDLTYSVAALHALGNDLAAVADVMERRDSRVQYEPDDVGAHVVHEALEHFSRNWDDRREVLVRSVRSVAGTATPRRQPPGRAAASGSTPSSWASPACRRSTSRPAASCTPASRSAPTRRSPAGSGA